MLSPVLSTTPSRAGADLCHFSAMLLTPGWFGCWHDPFLNQEPRSYYIPALRGYPVLSRSLMLQLSCCSSFCYYFLNYVMSPNMGFVKRRLERKITLHPQPNRLSSRMSPSYHIHRMEVQSGSLKSFFSILVFNLKLFFSCYVFSVKFMNWTKM